jgi:acetyl esterase/lipase
MEGLSILWRVLAAVAILAIVYAALRIVWAKSTVLQTALMRLICARPTDVKPLDYDAVLELIETRAKDVPYESRFPNGTMDVYARRSDQPQPLVVYAHGGYYVGGDKRGLASYCKKLASLGYVVANVDYRLAPEGRYPAQMLQLNEAAAFLLAHAKEYGIDANRVFFAGDSAGGHLASQMGLYYTNPAFRARIGGEPAVTREQLGGVILHCGYYNMETLRATKFPMIADSIWIVTGKKRFEGTYDAENMNTVAWVTPQYPPVFLSCGDRDPFITQAREMIAALEQNGVDVTAYLPVSGKRALWHEFQKELKTPEGAEAMERMKGFLGEKIS